MRLFNIISSIRIPLLSRIICKLISEQFRSAANYLIYKYEKDDILPEDIYINIIVFACIISIIISCVISLIFVKNLFISPSIFIFFLLLMYVILYYGIVSEYENDKLITHLYYFMALKDMALAYSSTKSIIEAIRFVVLGGYPVISDILKNIIKNIVNGLDPEKILIESNVIMEFDKSLDLQLSKLLSEVKKGESFYPQQISIIYDKTFAKLEIYCLLLLFLGFLLPMISLFIIMSMRIINIEIVLSFILIQIIVLTIFSKFLLTKIYYLVGVKR
ncbi:MAG: hypothetical protein QXS19_01395 [Candidatus Methanomethylicia archaeon]